MGRNGQVGMTGVVTMIITLMVLLCAACEKKNTELQPVHKAMKVITPVGSIHVVNDMLDELRVTVGFLPDGDALVVEKNRKIRLIRNIHRFPVPEPEPLALINTCDNEILLGIAIHPDFTNTREFYVCIAEIGTNLWHQRIEIWQLSPAKTSAKRKTVLHRDVITKDKKGPTAIPPRLTIASLKAAPML